MQNRRHVRRRFRRPRSCAVAAIAAALLPAAAGAAEEVAAGGATIVWTETARDVYIDGRRDDGAWVLVAADPARLAVAPSGSSWVHVLRDDGGLERIPRDRLAPVDGGDARSPEPEPAPGRVTRVETEAGVVDLVEPPSGALVVAPHLGASGPLDLEALWAWRPTWRLRRDAARPDAEVVAALAAVDRPHTVTIYLGTWCGDSRANVPGILAALEAAGNPNLSLSLVAIRRGMTEPMATVRDARLTNVPTVVVADEGGERGRLVETPAGESMAADLAALLAGAPTEHGGALAKEATVVRGRYRIEDAAGTAHAFEGFALYRTTADRFLLHCRSEDADGRPATSGIDAWHRFHRDGRTDFVEVTRTDDEGVARTRLSIGEDGLVLATTRGTPSGVVRQTLAIDDPRAVSAPCAASLGSLSARLGGATPAMAVAISTAGPAAVFVAPLETPNDQGTASVPTALGARAARRLASSGDVWLVDTVWPVALGGELAAGGRVVLERLETP